jgi:hypothetical protein
LDVETLALADICEVDDLLLADLLEGLVDGLDVARNRRDASNGTAICADHVLCVVIPGSEFNESFEEPRADDIELSHKDTTSVDVAACMKEHEQKIVEREHKTRTCLI